MRLLLSAASAGLVALAAPALAATAVDTTGTTYATDRVVVAMTFPVLGATSYSDNYLVCRSGCTRKHMGQDLMGAKMSPLLAAFTGTVSSLKRETRVGEGNYLVITGDNGWSAMYLHVNNDTPGTDDGRGTAAYAFPKGIEVGTRVLAGQLVGWRGDSGNAEATGPHLHFELRKGSGWSGIVHNAYPSLQSARRLPAALPSGPHPDGSLLRSTTGVLYVTKGAMKHPVSPGALAADGRTAAAALPASNVELRLYRTGTPLPLREGALVTAPGAGTWRVLGGTRYAATPLPGQRVITVAAADLAPLAVVETPTGPTAGMLVRRGGLTYQLDTEGVLHLVDRYVLASHGWTAADVVDLPEPPAPDPLPEPTELLPGTTEPLPDLTAGPEIGEPLGLRDATLVSISGTGPAVVSGGVVRRLWDTRQVLAYGYAGKVRQNVPAASVAGLPVGEIAGPLQPSWRR